MHLLPLMIWNVFYWDHALWSDEEMEELAIAIQEILFPSIRIDPPEDVYKNSIWRNQLCDVLVAWSHAFHKWDYLATGDKNFHVHKDGLKKLGIDEVLYPEDAARLCYTLTQSGKAL